MTRPLVVGNACATDPVGPGDPTFDKLCEIVDALTDLDVTIDGDVTVNVDSAPTAVEYCVGWCETITACYIKDVDDGMTLVGYLGADGFVPGASLPEGAVAGSCPMPTKTTKSVWVLPEDDCPQFQRFITALCYGPKTVTEVDGELVPLADTLEPGEILFPENQSFGSCVVCPVEPAMSYDVDTIAGMTVHSQSCEYDCELGVFTDPTIVTWGDVEIPVTHDNPWTMPQSEACGVCPGMNAKPVTTSGPADIRAWTYELKEC